MKNIFKSVLFSICLAGFQCKPHPPNFGLNPYADWSLNDPGLQRNSLYFPLAETWPGRVRTLDKVHKQTLVNLNEIDGYKEVPERSDKEELFAARLALVYQSLPEKVSVLLDRYLYGIYFVKNLGTTGVTGIIRYNKEPIGGIVFLDTDFLNQKANDWATFKEKSVFTEPEGKQIRVILENEETDTEAAALEFILLHEFGHILATVESHAPDYSETKRDYRNLPFFKGIWIGESISEFDEDDFIERKKIKFYSKEKINLIPEGLNLYKELHDLPFVTLYAATNADDSYAEAFASYVHLVLQGKPYEIHLIEPNAKSIIFRNGILRDEGKQSRKFFDKILSSK
ncbi:hypothetical protein [Leptospira ilyithenensis]|uniref:Uncharacterized protein n=1 Tax=Leptospira ilyithenensis TaxID=2484901 RepID=A0A4R9LQ78_9LEPT|nr:hypothetical protein [Leptospira ilyithenensis]TGN10367.1 hypothetical protein EHS11_08675 [Leptospira ilyithenensis]